MSWKKGSGLFGLLQCVGMVFTCRGGHSTLYSVGEPSGGFVCLISQSWTFLVVQLVLKVVPVHLTSTSHSVQGSTENPSRLCCSVCDHSLLVPEIMALEPPSLVGISTCINSSWQDKAVLNCKGNIYLDINVISRYITFRTPQYITSLMFCFLDYKSRGYLSDLLRLHRKKLNLYIWTRYFLLYLWCTQK